MIAPIDSFPLDLAWMNRYSGSQPTGLSPHLQCKESRWTR